MVCCVVTRVRVARFAVIGVYLVNWCGRLILQGQFHLNTNEIQIVKGVAEAERGVTDGTSIGPVVVVDIGLRVVEGEEKTQQMRKFGVVLCHWFWW
jgi:hypothetical protein